MSLVKLRRGSLASILACQVLFALSGVTGEPIKADPKDYDFLRKNGIQAVLDYGEAPKADR